MLILASSSPRRREILDMLGVVYRSDAADIDETIDLGESARAAAERLAGEKAQAVASRHPGAWVLGADTVVSMGGTVLGKPADIEDANRMLHSLSGHRHEVCTAVALIRDGMIDTRSEVTTVSMRRLDAERIHSYVETGEPMDRAGAYAAQGIGGALIERIEGDFFTVIGLPIATVISLLDTYGIAHVLTR